MVNSILNNGYISGAEILLAAEKEENVKKSYVSFLLVFDRVMQNPSSTVFPPFLDYSFGLLLG